jgi:hypothetical protein
VTDYQYDVNTRSHASFVKEYIEKNTNSEEAVMLIADGAYASEENTKLASEKNIRLMTTGLLGHKPREIFGKFKVNESGTQITGCPAGNKPKSSSYIKQTDSIRASFYRHQCEGCPYQDQCNPVVKEGTAAVIVPLKARRRILESSEIWNDATRAWMGRIRNGVETVSSVIRNKYLVDQMPVRGKLRIK